MNGATIQQVVVNNNNQTAGSGVYFGGVFNSLVRLTVNCAGPSYGGTGIQFHNATMNNIQVSAGSCGYGLVLSDDTYATKGNSFIGTDVEVDAVALLINGAGVQENTFIGGNFVAQNVGNIAIVATAGDGNKFINPNIDGAGTLCNGNQTGLIFEFNGSTHGTCGTVAGSMGTLSVGGHIGFIGPAPTIASGCTGGSVAAGSTDMAGEITGITSGTACLINFASGHNANPFCTVISANTSVAVGASAGTTTLNINTSATTNALTWTCSGA